MIEKSSQTNIWGRTIEKGIETLSDEPPFLFMDEVGFWDKAKIVFYPEKFLLYNFVRKALGDKKRESRQSGKFNKLKILDVGCGSAAAIIEMKKIWGKEIEVYGVDSVNLQVEFAKKNIKRHSVWADIGYYDGNLLPFKNNFFDVVISSGELNKFYDTYNWLEEVSRVLLPGGRLALACDSQLSKNSYIANYLDKRGVYIEENSDKYFQTKEKLENILQQNSFEIKKMYNVFGSSFILHPEKYFDVLKKQKKFLFWRLFNKLFFAIKKKSPVFLKRFFGFCVLLKILILGRFWRDRGYIVLAQKK